MGEDPIAVERRRRWHLAIVVELRACLELDFARARNAFGLIGQQALCRIIPMARKVAGEREGVLQRDGSALRDADATFQRYRLNRGVTRMARELRGATQPFQP